MRHAKGFTLVELLVVVAIVGILASMMVPAILAALQGTRDTVCLGNLRNIGTALGIYRQQNEQRWPWIPNVTADWSAVPTGTNRERRPDADEKDAGPRSITALMFLLVRHGQPPGLFICPDDDEAVEDRDIRWDDDRDPTTPPDFAWDFSSPRNVSYSWQAPIWKAGKYVNGLNDADSMAVVMGEKSPGADDPDWRPQAMRDGLSIHEIRKELSPNHRQRGVINLLRADSSAARRKRPDVGIAQDNVYTASNQPYTGSRSATSLDIREHLSPQDTFLRGPVSPDRDTPPEAPPQTQ